MRLALSGTLAHVPLLCLSCGLVSLWALPDPAPPVSGPELRGDDIWRFHSPLSIHPSSGNKGPTSFLLVQVPKLTHAGQGRVM